MSWPARRPPLAFYVVVVARDGYGLRVFEDGYLAPEGMTAEFTRQDNVEVFVLRQKTTETSGYRTNAGKAAWILAAGLEAAEQVAAGLGGEARGGPSLEGGAEE